MFFKEVLKNSNSHLILSNETVKYDKLEINYFVNEKVKICDRNITIYII